MRRWVRSFIDWIHQREPSDVPEVGRVASNQKNAVNERRSGDDCVAETDLALLPKLNCAIRDLGRKRQHLRRLEDPGKRLVLPRFQPVDPNTSILLMMDTLDGAFARNSLSNGYSGLVA